MKKIAIISSHPIQYNAPFFRLLANSGFAVIRVFYTLGQKEQDMYDPGFGLVRKWDIDLFSGYDFEFIPNVSKDPGTHHFMGIVNPGLSNRLDDFSPDAVMIYGWNFHSHLKLLQTYHRKAILLFRGDSTLLDEDKGFSLKKAIRRLFLKWVYRNVNYALSPGKASDDYFKSAGVDPKTIIRVPHSIDNSRFNEFPDHISDPRSELGIAKDALVFLFSGKLSKKKDPLTLMKAFIRLRQSMNDVHLVFVGSGELEEPLRALQEKNNLGHCVHFLGFVNQSEIPKIYAMSDVLVLPSSGPGETWGLAINEAMAAGIPVIASDHCGATSDMISEGINGYSFKAGSESDLLEKMRKISTVDLASFRSAATGTSERFSYEVALESIKSIPF